MAISKNSRGKVAGSLEFALDLPKGVQLAAAGDRAWEALVVGFGQNRGDLVKQRWLLENTHDVHGSALV